MVFIFLFSACAKKSEEGAHTLVLKNGTVLKGQLVSRNEAAIKFEAGGESREIPLEEVYSLTLKEGEAPVYLAAGEEPAPPQAGAQKSAAPQQPQPVASGQSQPASKPETQKATPPPPQPVTVPAGARLMIKLAQTISSQSHSAGSSFEGALETDLVADGKTVAPKGSKVYGKVTESRGGKAVGGSKLLATFTSITIDNQMVPIVTDDVGAESGKGGTAKKVGAGALIGAAAGDAGAGAAVGGAVALLSSRGNHIQIPAGTLVEVSLKQPFTVTK